MFDPDVIRLNRIDQIQLVLKAGAAPAFDADAQKDRMPRLFRKVSDLSRRSRRKGDCLVHVCNMARISENFKSLRRCFLALVTLCAKQSPKPKHKAVLMTDVLPLAACAENPEHSRGRLHAEPESHTRTAFARDRDRIIHSTAFRRLKGKTQVFISNEGDYFRTRLTHSLEVAQVARSLAHALGLNEDLAETVALSHDLGHPPFGHAGEEELDICMTDWGGFDHNVQSFRIVTQLEVRYPTFEGLNLAWETLEGIIKHNGPITKHLGRPSWKAVTEFNADWDIRPDGYASLEAQVAAISDDVAYNNHDVDDGVRAGLFTLDDLADVPLIGPALKSVHQDYPHLDSRMIRLEGVRRMIGTMIADVRTETVRRIKEDSIETAEDVRNAQRQMVAFSTGVHQDLSRLRSFLFERMYKHYRVNRTRSYSRRVLKEMFHLFIQEPDVLPPAWYERVSAQETETARAIVICDYIAGMTDGFALEEHGKLFGGKGSSTY